MPKFPPAEEKKELFVYRRMSLVAGLVYLVWWLGVEWLLPHSFNPFLSRFAISIYFSLIVGLSFAQSWFQRHLRLLALVGLWFMTLHYYYLFFGNSGKIEWVIGDYITVIAIGHCFMTSRGLLAYSCFVLLLSSALVAMLPALQSSVFLPGLLTILIQANIALRSRLNIWKEAEQEKIRNQHMAENVRLRDEFIQIASHEFKTPLTALKLQTQLLRRGIKGEDSGLLLLLRQVNRLTELVETLLDVSKISTGQLILRIQSLDVSKLIRELAKSFQSSHQSLSVHVPNGLFVNADGSRLTQVIENLVTNAMKYGEGKPIAISAHLEDDNLVIDVEDLGPGVSPQNIDRIFDRYERATSPTNISGFGLGLYIARQIVEAHSGQITVKSEVGTGTTFTVRIPAHLPINSSLKKIIDRDVHLQV